MINFYFSLSGKTGIVGSWWASAAHMSGDNWTAYWCRLCGVTLGFQIVRSKKT